MEQATIIQLPKFEDPRGNLSFIEEWKHIPFKIERTYWIYLSSYDELIFIYFHFDDLIIDSGIIKIASEQKEYQYSSDNIII